MLGLGALGGETGRGIEGRGRVVTEKVRKSTWGTALLDELDPASWTRDIRRSSFSPLSTDLPRLKGLDEATFGRLDVERASAGDGEGTCAAVLRTRCRAIFRSDDGGRDNEVSSRSSWFGSSRGISWGLRAARRIVSDVARFSKRP